MIRISINARRSERAERYARELPQGAVQEVSFFWVTFFLGKQDNEVSAKGNL